MRYQFFYPHGLIFSSFAGIYSKKPMKNVLRICCTTLLMAACIGMTSVHAQSYDQLWKEANQASRKSLPQTVISLMEQICRKATAEKNAPQLLKAYMCKAEFEESLTPDSFYTHLKDMEHWRTIEKDAVNKAILNSILAEEYATYANRHGYLLRQMTPLDPTLDKIPTDIREWSYNIFLDTIASLCQASLKDVPTLLKVNTTDYKPFVKQENGSAYYRHDLYHLLAKRAINIYEQYLSSDSLQTAHLNQFYRGLMNTYAQKPGMEEALALCSIDYWEWKYKKGLPQRPYETREEATKRWTDAYMQTLDSLINVFKPYKTCAEAYNLKAQLLVKEKRYTEALNLCSDGLKRYASYERVEILRSLREEIQKPMLMVSMKETAYPGDSLKLDITYKNLSEMTLRIYATDYEEVPYYTQGIPVDTYKKHAQLLHTIPVTLKHLPYNESQDYKQISQYPPVTYSIGQEGVQKEDLPFCLSNCNLSIAMPQKPGVYLMRVSTKEQKAEQACFVVISRFKVLLLDIGKGELEIHTLDAQSGHPIGGAQVTFYNGYGDDSTPIKQITTDAQGRQTVVKNKEMKYYVARKGDDNAMRKTSLYLNISDEPTINQAVEEVILLTDRTIYRPGQTVHVKGIAYIKNENRAHVVEKGTTYELDLIDCNGKQLSTSQVKTNDFGSFSTDFILPMACLNGQFRVQLSGKNSNNAYFQVEEYKRPTFEINIDPIDEAYRLGDTVTLKGQVRSFNGMSVQNVPLAYTLTRTPLWWRGNQESLVSDTVALDAEGRFALSLHLERKKEFMPSFDYCHYEISLSVTDGTGETQTANHFLTAGENAYTLDTDVPDMVCKENSLCFNYYVQNINGKMQNHMEGIYKLYRIEPGNKYPEKEELMAMTPAFEDKFKTNRPIDCSGWRNLPSGRYIILLTVEDSLGRKESNYDSHRQCLLFSKKDKRPPVYMEQFYYAESEQFSEEKPASFLFGTSYADAYVLMHIYDKNSCIESQIIQLSDSIARFTFPYKPIYGNNVTVRFCFVKEDKLETRSITLSKTDPDRNLRMKWKVFRDRLRPGQKEEWQLVIQTPQDTPAQAEVLACLYDASLDRLMPNQQRLSVFFPRTWKYWNVHVNNSHSTGLFLNYVTKQFDIPHLLYDHFWNPEEQGEIIINSRRLIVSPYTVTGAINSEATRIRGIAPAQTKMEATDVVLMADESIAESGAIQKKAETEPSAEENIRTNFSETAFFYPQLRTDKDGSLTFAFTVPQSLTRWNFRGYAHTKDMLTGLLEDTVVTNKEFMLTPNMPRFVRCGDDTNIAAKVANQTGKQQKGTTELTLFDPVTEKKILTRKTKFQVEAGETQTVSFHFEVPQEYDLLGVRIVAETSSFSDGEQHILPILSDKEHIVETLPMPVRGEETRTFTLDSLFNHQNSSASNRHLTLEFTSNPVWYAIQSLPTMVLPATDNAIDWAVAYYANALAMYVAHSQPQIQRTIETWMASNKREETLQSRLQANEEVKGILLDQSPWVIEAQNETDRMRALASLFDSNQMDNRMISALTKLKDLQEKDGGWTWFKGMPSNPYATRYIVSLLVRLPQLTGKPLTDESKDMVTAALGYLHKQAVKEYHEMLRMETQGHEVKILSKSALDYLYLVALWGEEVPTSARAAYHYFMQRVYNELTNGSDMLRKSHAAVILIKAGKKQNAADFIASLDQHLVREAEIGAHFAFNDRRGYGIMTAITPHVAAMEAFRLYGGKDALLKEMQIWLLKQKQTTAWNSSVASADAIYALLCGGIDMLQAKTDTHIYIGKETIETSDASNGATAGLGYIKVTYQGKDPQLKAREITVEQHGGEIAWGAVYAQYLSPFSDLEANAVDGMSVTRTFYVERIQSDGSRKLQAIDAKMKLYVGDVVVSRLVIRLDRAMDFIQLQDQRAACLEPLTALSGYRYKAGTGYYQDLKDASTRFFFDHLGKGTYVLEHRSRIVRAGRYQTGIATLQSAYAPEFASHTAGMILEITE